MYAMTPMGEQEAREKLVREAAWAWLNVEYGYLTIHGDPDWAEEMLDGDTDSAQPVPGPAHKAATAILDALLAHPETLIAAANGVQVGSIVANEHGSRFFAWPHQVNALVAFGYSAEPVFVFPAPAERNTP